MLKNSFLGGFFIVTFCFFVVKGTFDTGRLNGSVVSVKRGQRARHVDIVTGKVRRHLIKSFRKAVSFCFSNFQSQFL